jgi:integrase
MLDNERVLTRAETALVVTELRRKAKRYYLTRRNLILFDLATFCGLRVSEICGLRLGDIRLGISPSIRIPATLGKGSKPRTVPLTWDADCLADITAWVALHRARGACDTDFVLHTRTGGPVDRHTARMIYVRACRLVGRHVTIHAGRHTFVSLALNARRHIAAVMAAAGHASLHTTSMYTHLVEPDEELGSLL